MKTNGKGGRGGSCRHLKHHTAHCPLVSHLTANRLGCTSLFIYGVDFWRPSLRRLMDSTGLSLLVSAFIYAKSILLSVKKNNNNKHVMTSFLFQRQLCGHYYFCRRYPPAFLSSAPAIDANLQIIAAKKYSLWHYTEIIGSKTNNTNTQNDIKNTTKTLLYKIVPINRKT